MVGPLFNAVSRKARCKSQLTPYMNAWSLARTEKNAAKIQSCAGVIFFERFGELKRSGTMRQPIPLNRRVQEC